jgi:hypothetical protein
MRFHLRSHIIIFILSLCSGLAIGQVKFEAKVSKKKLGINERLRIDFEMNKDGDNFNPPEFNDFLVVGGPNTSVSNSWLNGKRSYKKTYTYFLAPRKKGKFTINQATIEIEGETYKTFPVTIEVTEAVDKPGGSDNASYIASEKIHLVAEVSKRNPYINEAITVVYKLYVALDTGVSNWTEKENPRFNDFWSQNIEIKGFKAESGQYNGEDYRYVVLKKAVLYPQKSGKLNLEPYVLDVTVEVPTSRYDIFGNRIMTKVPQTVTAGAVAINAKPLPEEGKPLDFKGAVGDFQFNVTTSKQSLNATESLQAKIEVTGKGNLKLFELPELNVPSSLEVYEPEYQDNVRTDLRGMRGSISNTYTIVPQYRGKYPIPSISFSYFDLGTESYKRVNSDEIVIDVLEGPNSESAGGPAAGAASNAPVKSPLSVSDQFAFIKTTTSLKPIESNDFFQSKLFWSLLLLPFLAIPVAIVFRRQKEIRDSDVEGNKVRKADKLARKYLGKAKKELGQKDTFYIALEKALHNYLKAKLYIETSELSKERIAELLSQRQVAKEYITSFQELLENCELARYTPSTEVAMKADYDKSAKTIGSIDKQLR